jgi:hypothetical protein
MFYLGSFICRILCFMLSDFEEQLPRWFNSTSLAWNAIELNALPCLVLTLNKSLANERI